MNYTFLDFLILIGSLGMFLYGMKVMSEGLQKVAGDRLRSFFSVMTKNPLTGVFTGILITALIQSSSATTVMVVSFVNAGLLSLAQSISVIMGANVGTTATAWIITLFGFKVEISLYALPLIGIAIPLIFSKNNKRKSWGEFIVGFALLFMGLDYLNRSVPDLQSNPDLFNFLTRYASMGVRSIFIFMVVGIVVTLIVQSSSVTFAITLIMCSKGWISFDIACAIILGGNIGTTITPLMASIGANVAARRAALAHLLFNLFGAVWLMCVFYPFVDLSAWLTGVVGQGDPDTLYRYTETLEQTSPELINQLNNGLLSPDSPEMRNFLSMQLAVSFGLSIFHTLYNLINLSIMIWFVKVYVKILTSLVKVKNKEDEGFQLKFISRGLLSTSELSLLQARKEIALYAERTSRMYEMVHSLLHEKEGSEAYTKIYNRIEKYEMTCDRIEIEIADYLAKVSDGRLSQIGKRQISAMLTMTSEIESIGDCCYNMARTLQRKSDASIDFNDQIVENIDHMVNLVNDALANMVSALDRIEVSDAEMNAAYGKEVEINNFRNHMRSINIQNINEKRYDYQAGIYFMDMISESEKLGDYVVNVLEAAKERRHANVG